MSAVDWFEIPAQDFDRAVAFYESLLQLSLRREIFGSMPNAVFPYDEATGTGGAVALMPHAKPGTDGPILYLNAHSTAVFDDALVRVESLGGKLVAPKTDLGPNGHIALIIDSEGNRVGLHVAEGA